MGNTQQKPDNRPHLLVTIKRASHIASPNHEPKGTLNPYLQLTYGYITKPKSQDTNNNSPTLTAVDSIRQASSDLFRRLSTTKSYNSDDGSDSNSDSDTNNNNGVNFGTINEDEEYISDDEDEEMKINYNGVRSRSTIYHQKNNCDRNSLSAGQDGTRTLLSNIGIISDNNYNDYNFYDDIIQFPLASINARHSLEISLWNKHKTKLDNSYLGKCIIYYGKHIHNDDPLNNKGDFIATDATKIYQYFLPIGFNNKKTIIIDINDNINNIFDESSNNGKIELTLEYINKPLTMDEIQTIKSTAKNLNKKNNRRRKSGERMRVVRIDNLPYTSCCGF